MVPSIDRVIVVSILAASQVCLVATQTLSITGSEPSSNLTSTVLSTASGTEPSSVANSVPNTVNLTSTVSASATAVASSTSVSASNTLSLTTTSATNYSGTTGTIGTAIPVSSLFPANATTSGIGPGGIAVQPTANPAEIHSFSPFPSPTQSSVPGIFPASDPLSPPDVSSNAPIIPDFNPAWSAALEKAKALISGLGVEEKVNFTTGIGLGRGRCVGNIPPIPIDGSGTWQGICLEDGPLGVRPTDFVTVFPAGVNAAATWRRDLIRKRGAAIGEEFRGKGVNVAFSPAMNLARVPQAGRNWEYFGADPFLTGEAAYETILGLQSAGVQANAKHFADNEQEHGRLTGSSNVDDRTQHEIYAHPFLRSVMAGVASIMCAVNRINETWVCGNDRMQNEILKGEYGFRGYIISDWGAQHSTLDALFGLDMTMPGDIDFSSGFGSSYWGANLTAYVRNGSIPEERLDDMATRIAAGWYFLHQDEGHPAVNFNANDPVDSATNERVDVQDDHAKIVREIGTASTVLLKNENNTLPLCKPRRITLFGIDAAPQPGGPNQYTLGAGNQGILAVGWGSGTANFSYLVSPLEAIQHRARKDRTTVDWYFDNWNVSVASNMAVQTDVALVFINSDSGEEIAYFDGNEGDRKNLTAWHNGDALVSAVADNNANTVVVVHSVGPIIIEPWIDHPNVTAVVWAGLGGTETGNALADVLYGDVNPSGRLPYTIAKNVSDYGAQLTLGADATGELVLQVSYTDELLIDYRHFDANGIEPRFEFGFGLSYTTFAYTDLWISEVENQSASDELRTAWKNGDPSPTGHGSSAALWLHEPAYRVTFTVQNTGDVAGTEIPQLYVHHPDSAGEPPSILKGFMDVYLKAGESKTMSIPISRYDLSVWDVVTQSWRRPQGEIKLSIGASSRDLRLQGDFP